MPKFEVQYLGSVPVPRFRQNIVADNAYHAAQKFIQGKIDNNLLDPNQEYEVQVWNGQEDRYFLIQPEVHILFTTQEYDKNGNMFHPVYFEGKR